MILLKLKLLKGYKTEKEVFKEFADGWGKVDPE